MKCASNLEETVSILAVDGYILSGYEEINCTGESAAFLDLFVKPSSAN